MPPVVTVAIPAYNAAAYLEAAVQSALAQSLAAIEVIIIDDCSTDATGAVAAKLEAADARVRVDRLACNGGPAAARNRALALARGRWFAVLDSDDMFAPRRLAALTAAGDRAGADIVVDNLVLFGSGATARFFLDPTTSAGWISLLEYLRRTVIYGDGANLGYLKPLIRLDRLRAAGVGYDERLRIAEDDDFIVRALLAGLSYWFEPIPGYGYRRHAGSTSHRLSAANAQAMLAAGERHAAQGSAQSIAVREALKRRCAGFSKASALAAFMAALKDRQPVRAAGIAVAHPAMLGLLHMPLGAALERLRPAWMPRPAIPEGPDATAALAALLPAGARS